MLNGDFHEGPRIPTRLGILVSPLMGFLSVHTCPIGPSFLAVNDQLPPDALPELTDTDRCPDAGITGVIAGAPRVWRYAYTIPLQEKSHAEGGARKELLCM